MKTETTRKSTLIFILLCSLISCIQAQEQIGTDIDGEESYDLSGWPIALSSNGLRVAICAIGNDGNGLQSGHIRVFDFNGTDWIQAGTDLDGEGGISVLAISSDGNRLAYREGSSGSSRIRILDWVGNDWEENGVITPGSSNNPFTNLLGVSLSFSMNGNQLAIGDTGRQDANGNTTGMVRIMEWDGMTWSQSGEDIYGDASFGDFGRRLSITENGNRIAIGSPDADVSFQSSGMVQVFERVGDVWSQQGEAIIGDHIFSIFGTSVSLSASGNRLAVGSPTFGGLSIVTVGLARVYDWNGTEWAQVGNDFHGPNSGDRMGIILSLSDDGNRIVLQHKNSMANDAGQVQVYDWTGTDWEQWGNNIDGEAEGDYSGNYLALSANGKRVAIGAMYNNDNGQKSGHCRMYSLCESFNYTHQDVTVCGLYQGPDGQAYETSGQYLFIESDALGCDDILSVDLSVVSINNDIVVDELLLSVAEVDTTATYQWFDCDAGIPIPNQIETSFMPTESGNYAFQITTDFCETLSECVSLIVTDVSELTPEISLYPNPVSDWFLISKAGTEPVNLNIVDVSGRVVLDKNIVDRKTRIDTADLPAGLYFIVLSGSGERVVRKFYQE